MSDRVKALTVNLTRDFRDDDVESLAQAIGHMTGVLSVETRKVSTDDYLNRDRIRREFEVGIYEAIQTIAKASR